MSAKVSILIFLVLFAQLVHADTFSPENCEFTVEFPSKYKTKKIITGTGETVIAAQSVPGGPTLLNAECWVRENITIDDYAEVIRPMLIDRGFEVFSVSIRKEITGNVVTVAGAVGKHPKRFHVRFESFFGQKTRLDLLIVEDDPVPTKEHVRFRQSVKLR